MAGEKRDAGRGGGLERAAREVVRASAAGEHEAAAVADSPFLYARVRARIEAERRRREEGEGWLALFGVVWRAAPAMALAAVLALALFLTAGGGELAPGAVEDALLGEREGDIEQVVFADVRAASGDGDEVLSNIIGAGENSR